jgi:hypothetical protein
MIQDRNPDTDFYGIGFGFYGCEFGVDLTSLGATQNCAFSNFLQSVVPTWRTRELVGVTLAGS